MDTDTFFWLLIAAVILVTIVGFGLAQAWLVRTLRAVEERVHEGIAQVNAIISDKLSPTIYAHDSKDTVRRTAGRLLREACSRSGNDRFCTFYGAAALSAQRSADLDEESKSALADYKSALDEATRTRLRVTRYVSLFTEEEYQKRSRAVQEQYLTWLKGQQSQLLRDDSFVLYDIVRAPKWGANMARIITSDAVMEITGNGRAAVVVEDSSAASTIREYARAAVLDGEIPPTEYSLARGAQSLDSFKDYIERIESLPLNEPPAASLIQDGERHG